VPGRKIGASHPKDPFGAMFDSYAAIHLMAS
jgi:hypothetical protein